MPPLPLPRLEMTPPGGPDGGRTARSPASLAPSTLALPQLPPVPTCKCGCFICKTFRTSSQQAGSQMSQGRSSYSMPLFLLPSGRPSPCTSLARGREGATLATEEKGGAEETLVVPA